MAHLQGDSEISKSTVPNFRTARPSHVEGLGFRVETTPPKAAVKQAPKEAEIG